MKTLAFICCLISQTCLASLFSDSIAFKGVLQQSGATVPVVGLAVDTFLDFHAQTLGAVYNTNLIQSDVWGNTSLWSVTSDGSIAPNTFTNVVIPNFPFAQSIQTPDGHIATGTGTLGVRQDLAEGVNGTMILKYSGFSAHLISCDFWLMFTNISCPFSSYDLYLFFSNPWAVAHFFIPGTQIQAYEHTANGQASFTGNISPNLWVHGRQVQDMLSGASFVTYWNATNGAFLFSSIDYQPSSANLQHIFTFEGGYIFAAGDSGYVYRTPCYLQTDANVSTNSPPWVPNVPSNLAAAQNQSGRGIVSIDANNFMLNSNRVSVSNASAGEIVQWTSPAATTSTFSGLALGTYDVRAQAYFLGGVKSGSLLTSLSVTNWPQPVTNGLVLRWLLNENDPGDAVVLDHWTNGYTGSFQGTSPTWSLVTAPTNYAIVLNGTDGYIVKSASPIQTVPFTISLWVSNYVGIVSSIGSLNTSGYDGWFSSIDCSLGTASSVAYVNNTFVDTGALATFTPGMATWHNIVCVYTSASSKDVWIDGVKGTTDTGTFSPNQGNYALALGAIVKGNVSNIATSGSINDVQLFNRALTSDEIAYIYGWGPDMPPE